MNEHLASGVHAALAPEDPAVISTDIVEAQVRLFAQEQANAVFAVWEADGDFMSGRAAADAAIKEFATELVDPSDSRRAAFLQCIGIEAYCQQDAALTEQWDFRLALQAATQERAGGARRRRHHHIRSVFR